MLGKVVGIVKKLVSILLCLCTMAALISASGQVEVEEKTQLSKGLLMYVGYWGYYNDKYPVPTDEELEEILKVTDEIILVPTAAYNCYTDKETGRENQVLTHRIIENMDPDWVANPGMLDELKALYHDYASSMIYAGYNISDYVADAVELGNRIVEINPDAKLWYSVPGAPQLTALTHLFADSWVQCVEEVKEALDPEVWENNVCGFYYSDEDVVTFDYAKFDPSKPEENFDNPDVYVMRQVSDKVHSYDKELIWIPYSADTNSSIYECLGYVANKTDIFDAVIIQPSYFFNSEYTDNLELIRDCVEQQAVLYNFGYVIGGEKTSDTVIGWEMEIDATDLANDPGAEARYQAYVDTFKDLVGVYPTAYYASIVPETVEVLDKIADFYGVQDPVSSSSSSYPSENPSASSSEEASSASDNASSASAESSSVLSSSASRQSSSVANPETGESVMIGGVAVLALMSAAAVLVLKKRR